MQRDSWWNNIAVWCACVFLLMPTSVWAAAATCVDAGAVELHSAAPTDPLATNYTKPAGDNQITFLGIGFRNGAGVTISGVTMNGNAMTADTTFQYQGTLIGGNLYYYKNPPSGSVSMSVDFSGSVSQAHIIVWTCSNVDLTTFRSFSSAKGTSTAPAVTPATVQTGDVVVDFIASDENAANPTVGANQTEIHTGNTSTTNSGASYQAGADGAAMTWTLGTSSHWVIFSYVVQSAPDVSRGRPVMFQ